MSLRPEMFGFRLHMLRALLGSGNTDILARLAAATDGLLDFECPAELETIITKAIAEGVPFAGLDTESAHHVEAITLLVRHTQQLTPLDSNAWKMGAFMDLEEKVRHMMSPEPHRLLAHFLDGRPVFGKRIATQASAYGYLSLAEIAVVCGALRLLRERDSALQQPEFLDGFLAELLQWMETLMAAGFDLWWYAE